MNIPEKLINFKTYLSGNPNLAGMADVTLPDIEQMAETIEGAGIAGAIDSITPGHTSAMNLTINFRTVTQSNISFAAPKCYELEFKGAIQETDPSTRKIEVIPLSVAVRAYPKKTGLGKLAVSKTMDTTVDFTVDYLKIERKGKTHIEIDKLNMIYIVDGYDYLSEVRTALGM